MTSTSGQLDPRLQDSLHAAHLYYVQDMKMEAIASEMGTSRSSVSRMLAHARETGLVEIRIHSPLHEPGRLEETLSSRYSIAAHVVPVPDRASGVDRLERVARTAARLTSTLFTSNMTLGLAWGVTVDTISRFLPRRRTSNARVLQLNGAGNYRTTGVVYASEILRRFGEAFGAQVQQFPVPTFFDDPLTKDAMWRERSTMRLLEAQRHVDIALFGIGSPFAEIPSHVYAGGYLEEVDYDALSKLNVVGDVATVFFRADGSDSAIPLNKRSSGPDLRTFRLIPRRICAVAGLSKLDGVRGALAANLITDLVIDERTARELLVEY